VDPRIVKGNRDALVASFASVHRLSSRERALLLCAVAGRNNDEAAAELGCSRATVATYWNRIFSKVGRHCQRDVICQLLELALTELHAQHLPESL
jgi:DNA-binding NarL/FixJ family response regulator